MLIMYDRNLHCWWPQRFVLAHSSGKTRGGRQQWNIHWTRVSGGEEINKNVFCSFSPSSYKTKVPLVAQRLALPQKLPRWVDFHVVRNCTSLSLGIAEFGSKNRENFPILRGKTQLRGTKEGLILSLDTVSYFTRVKNKFPFVPFPTIRQLGAELGTK